MRIFNSFLTLSESSISEPPLIREFHFEPEILSGSDTQLQCYIIQGDPPLHISWYFHGQEVSHVMGVSTMKLGTKSSILSIEHVTHGHSGKYTCVASNRAGEARYSATLVVHGNGGNMYCTVLSQCSLATESIGVRSTICNYVM